MNAKTMSGSTPAPASDLLAPVADKGRTRTGPGKVVLEVKDLRVSYGGIQAVKGISFHVLEGELVSLIGANGAGKSTTLKAITALQTIGGGNVSYLDKPVKGQGAWDLVKQGLIMVPEGRGTFTRMSIIENLQMGAFVRNDNEIACRHGVGVRPVPALERAAHPAGRHHVGR